MADFYLKVFLRANTVNAQAGLTVDWLALHKQLQSDPYCRLPFGVGKKTAQLLRSYTAKEVDELLSLL